MMIRIASVVLVTLLVGGSGYLYGPAGALLALPVAVLISFATERLIARIDSDASAEARRVP